MSDPVIVPRAEHTLSRRLVDPEALKVLYRLQQAGFTGYLVGGTSPFGTKTANLPDYVERTIFDQPRIYINGGKRGFLVSLTPDALRQTLPVREIEVAAPTV